MFQSFLSSWCTHTQHAIQQCAHTLNMPYHYVHTHSTCHTKMCTHSRHAHDVHMHTHTLISIPSRQRPTIPCLATHHLMCHVVTQSNSEQLCVCVCVCVCACVCVQPVHDNMQLELFALSYIQICTCASCVRSSCQSECSPRHVASSRSCQVCSLDHRTLSGLGIQESLLLVTTGSPICARFASLLFSTAS